MKAAKAPLGLLGSGRYLAETVRDGDHGLIRETRIVRRGDTLTVPQPANGGFLTVLCGHRSGMSTCDRPVRRVPQTTHTVDPAGTDLRPGQTLPVTATFTLSSGGPLREVDLRVDPPAGWSVSGSPVHAANLAGGKSLRGAWRITAPAEAPPGYVDVPVVASYRFRHDPADRPVHLEQAVQVFLPPDNPTGEVYVSDLPLLTETNGWGPVERDRSNGESDSGDGATLSIRSHSYAKSLGMHAPGEVTVWLGGACQAFTAQVGVDDEVTQPGSVDFQVLGDGGTALASTGLVRSADQPRELSVDVSGVRMLTLRVTDGGDGRNYDHADWADARLRCASN